MGSWVYSWIIDHWGVNVAGILLMLFVLLYFYAETFGSFSFSKRKSAEGPTSNKSNSDMKTHIPAITTTLTYLKSSERR
jgi:hypothetical protein